MRAIQKLKQVGFDIWLEGEKIRYKQRSENPVDEVWVNNLLQNIKEYKQEAIEYLQPKQEPALKQDSPSPVTIFDPTSTSDAIPDPSCLEVERNIPACPVCHENKWWLSVYNVRICGVCHPPARERLVKEKM
jgi:hypothetical protein